MRDDEFNNLKIVNDENNPNSEFGATPDSESESFKDNSYDIRDEVNDNPTSNNENKSPEEKKREQEEGNNSSSDGSNKSSSHGGGASGIVSGAVVGAALVSIVALSTLVGINLYISAKCEFSRLELTETDLAYTLNLTETNNDSFAITLKNSALSYSESQDLVEGDNEGTFEGLTAGTNYQLEVIDLSAANYAIYSQTVRTTGGSPEGYVTITFVANNGTDETMDPVVLPVGTEYTLPACEFSDPDLHQMFKGWQINGTYAGQYYSWKVKTDTVLTATWQDADVVTYDDTFGNTYIDKVQKDSNIYTTLAEAPFDAPEGKALIKWRVEGKEEPVIPGDWVTYSGDFSISAIWGIPGLYTITFDPGEGSVGDVEQQPITGYENDEVTIPACVFLAPSDTKYFSYWYDSLNRRYYPGDPYTITDDITLTAYWADKTPHDITYYAGDDTTSTSKIVTVYEQDTNYLLDEAPDNFEIPTGKLLAGWTDGLTGDTYGLGAEITVTKNLTFFAIWDAVDPTINSIKFLTYLEDETTGLGTLTLDIDFDDPGEAIDKFTLSIKNSSDATIADIDIDPDYAATTSYQVGDSTHPLDYKNRSVYPYELKVTPKKAGASEYTALTGYLCPQDIANNVSMSLMTVYSSSNPNYWVENGNSYLPVNVTLNEDNCKYDNLYLRLTEITSYGSGDPTLASDYTYVPVSLVNGAQILEIPFVIPSPNDVDYNFWDMALVTNTGNNQYTTITNYATGQSDIDGTMHNRYTINRLDIAAIVTFSFDGGTLPTNETSATNVKINLDGYSLSGMNRITESYLTFEFYDPSSPITYTLPVTIDPDVLLSNKCAYIDLTAVTNSSNETDFEGFVDAIKTRPCSVKLTVKNNGYNANVTCYTNHSFL